MFSIPSLPALLFWSAAVPLASVFALRKVGENYWYSWCMFFFMNIGGLLGIVEYWSYVFEHAKNLLKLDAMPKAPAPVRPIPNLNDTNILSLDTARVQLDKERAFFNTLLLRYEHFGKFDITEKTCLRGKTRQWHGTDAAFREFKKRYDGTVWESVAISAMKKEYKLRNPELLEQAARGQFRM